MKYLSVNNIKKVLSITLVLISVCAFAQPDKPNPPTFVNDFATLFTPEQRTELETYLVDFSKKTSNQIVIVTVNDLEGNPASAYATAIGEKWGIGNDKFDNGIVMLIKPKNDTKGEVAIAIGYGLEGAIPDALANRTIDEKMMPYFKENDYYTAVAEALNTLIPIAAGEISYEEVEDDSLDYPLIIGITLVLIAIVAWANRKSKKDEKSADDNDDHYYYSHHDRDRDSSSSSSTDYGDGSFGGGGADDSWDDD